MVDRIIEIRGDESAIGIKNVTANEPQFLGHFPGNPVFPGVLLIEGMAQTAGAICVMSLPSGGRPQVGLFPHHRQGEVPQARGAGRHDRIPRDARSTQRKTMWWFRGEAKVAGQLVAEAEVGAMIADA